MDEYMKKSLDTLKELVGKEALIELKGGSIYFPGDRMKVKVVAVHESRTSSEGWAVDAGTRCINLEDIHSVAPAEITITGVHFVFWGPPLPPPREFNEVSPTFDMYFNQKDAEEGEHRVRCNGFSPYRVDFTSEFGHIATVHSEELSELYWLLGELQKRWLQGSQSRGTFFQLFFKGLYAERQLRKHFSEQGKGNKAGE